MTTDSVPAHNDREIADLIADLRAIWRMGSDAGIIFDQEQARTVVPLTTEEKP